ncbi:MAG: endonuclease MutS2 [Syntrophomonadaceae bacterium]|nr:endonuclease MutS2 [Syntrophomonadaceae bacterium]
MNKEMLRKLEYHKIQQKLAELASFEGGRKLAMEMMPSTDCDIVNMRLDETKEAMEALRFNEPFFLSGLKLVDHQLAKARVNGLLHPAELWDIYLLLHSSRLARKYVAEGKYPRLQNLCAGISENRSLERTLYESVSEDGVIRDDASPGLKSVRNGINISRMRIKDYLQSFIRSANNQKLLQDAIVTERDGRYVVPVKQEHRNDIKGIIHAESASGATVFIEPLAVVEHNNKIRSMQMEEKRELERIIRKLSDAVAALTDELATNQNILGIIDLIFARARLAYRTNSYRPEINTRGIVEINRGKHPLLGEEAVPINIEIGKRFDILVITGPNTGGKTVVLKTVGLLTVMAMSGLFIPARENSCISIFDSIYVDIGDEQSIEQSLSTFSSHMNNIINILKRADERSLVLLDELGAGTDPVEGAALARVVLEELRSQKAKAVVTTHQSELKNYAYQNERVENACVEFDPVSLRPTYKLTIGMPGQSNAFQIAAHLGLDDSLVERARELVPRREMELGDMIRHLKESRFKLDTSNREIEDLRAEILQEKQALDEAKKVFSQERAEIIDKARTEAEKYLREVKNEANEAVQELKELLKDKQKPPKWHEVEKKRQKLRQITVKKTVNTVAEDLTTDQLRPGDYVLIRNINQKGYILDGPDVQGDITVQVGIMKLNVNQSQVVKTDSPEEKTYKWRNQTFLEKARHISKEIDVRGKLAEDALIDIDKYLEDANLVGLDSVCIIHGKGTGALRKAVRNYLRDHRYVKSFRDGLREEGGFGVTIIEFK